MKRHSTARPQSSSRGSEYTCKASVWVYQGPAAWHFLSLSRELSARIEKAHHRRARGWGSLRVRATIGKTSWETSIFPDRKSETYLLPLKLKARQAEEIADGDMVKLALIIL